MALKKNSRPGKPRTRRQLDRAKAEMVSRHVVQLTEYFSSVQIVCTDVVNPELTNLYAFGSGDLYARAMSAESWLGRLKL